LREENQSRPAALHRLGVGLDEQSSGKSLLIQTDYAPPWTHATRVNKLPHARVVVRNLVPT